MKIKFFLSVVVFCALSTGALPVVKADDKTNSRVIRVTPPAPKFTDAERQAELARRRAEVAKRMLPNSILILRSAEARNYAGGVNFMYRQENNLYYLTNLKQGGSTYVLIKDGETCARCSFCQSAIRRGKPGTAECIQTKTR